MLWEARTYLRRLYGLGPQIRDKEGKAASKELHKAPTKVHGVTGDKFWEAVARNMAALDSEDNMVTKCREFATLLAIDEEFNIANDDADDDGIDGSADLDETAADTHRPGKRKNSVSGSNPIKRPRGRKSTGGRKRASIESEEESWE